jgi:hypothetical protein
LSSTLIPTQIVGFVSITGSQFVTINNPQQTLAYIQQGLFVSSTNTALQQCLNLNTGGGGIDSNINNGVLSATTAINLREGFAQSFKRRNYELGANPPAGGGVGTVTDLPEAGGQNERPQNIPGYAYNTESGFEPSTDGTTFNGPWGRADTGTRFVLRFSGIGQGARIFLPIWVPLTTSNSACSTGNPTPPSAINAGGACGGTWTGGFLRLIGTSDINGNLGSFSNAFPNVATFSGANPFGLNTPFRVAGGLFLNYAEITSPALSGGTAAAVYEVGNSDPSAVENANIAVAVAFVANTANNLPATGQVSVDAQFAPLSPSSNAGWGQASGSLPIPRFCDRPNPIGTFNISQCVCNLLFPFVSQAPGFDTGIAIANTSLDNINGVPVETGTIRMDFYGTGTGGIGFCTGSTTTGCMPASLQSQNTTVPMPGGNVMTYTLYGGPGNTYATGLQAVPGFTGYIVAQTKFRWCHGFAFLSDLGAQKLAEGYLAIQLDIYGGSGLNRTGVVGEVQAH